MLTKKKEKKKKKMQTPLILVLLTTAAVRAHELANMPINTELGVPGFPDCVRANPQLVLTVEEAAQDLICEQKG